MAIVQVSVFEAVNAVTGRYPPQRAKLTPAPGRLGGGRGRGGDARRALEAHAGPAGGHRRRLPGAARIGPRRPREDRGHRASASRPPTAIVALCADDGAVAPDVYRPHTTAGVYVPTVGPAVPHWGRRRPWVMTARRPVPSRPAARAHQRHLGARLQRDQGGRAAGTARSARRSRPRSPSSGKRRRPPSTGRSRARSPAMPGRDVTDNARLFAAGRDGHGRRR